MIKRYRYLVILSALAHLIFLAACGGNEPPVLVVPTPANGAAATPTIAPTADNRLPTIAPTAIVPTPIPTKPQSTATLPAPPTVAPPLSTATPGAQSTAAPTAVAPTTTPIASLEPTTDGDYRVAFVADDDTLNVRRRPSADAAVITELPADTTGIQVIGEGESVRGDSLWLPVETNAGDGWVNSHFLTEDVSRDAFCADPEVDELLEKLQAAIEGENGKLLGELVHPDRGLRLRLNWWNEEILVTGEDVQTLFRAQKKYDWGIEDGSGEAIRGSFSEIVMPRLERDLLNATMWNCDEALFGNTAGATVLPEGYEAVRFYSAHRAPPTEQELDWGTWLIGVERWQGRYYISYLVHYRWEI